MIKNIDFHKWRTGFLLYFILVVLSSVSVFYSNYFALADTADSILEIKNIKFVTYSDKWHEAGKIIVSGINFISFDIINNESIKMPIDLEIHVEGSDGSTQKGKFSVELAPTETKTVPYSTPLFFSKPIDYCIKIYVFDKSKTLILQADGPCISPSKVSGGAPKKNVISTICAEAKFQENFPISVYPNAKHNFKIDFGAKFSAIDKISVHVHFTSDDPLEVNEGWNIPLLATGHNLPLGWWKIGLSPDDPALKSSVSEQPQTQGQPSPPRLVYGLPEIAQIKTIFDDVEFLDGKFESYIQYEGYIQNVGGKLTTYQGGHFELDKLTLCLDYKPTAVLSDNHNLVKVCHIPPGYSEQMAISIDIPKEVLEKHLRHGDYLGSCKPTGKIIYAMCNATIANDVSISYVYESEVDEYLANGYDFLSNPTCEKINKGSDFVVICHKPLDGTEPITMWIISSLFDEHYSHGDMVGQCDNFEPLTPLDNEYAKKEFEELQDKIRTGGGAYDDYATIIEFVFSDSANKPDVEFDLMQKSYTYETYPWRIHKIPTVCAEQPRDISDALGKVVMDATKQGILNWKDKLQNAAKFPENWEIKYSQFNESIKNCDYVISFKDKNEAPVREGGKIPHGTFVFQEPPQTSYLEIFLPLTNCEILEAYNQKVCYDNLREQLTTITQHEFGHAIGLDHYISSDDYENRVLVGKGLKVPPSIMIISYDLFDEVEITQLDVEKVLSIYGENGFYAFEKTMSKDQKLTDNNREEKEFTKTEPILSSLKNNAKLWSEEKIDDETFLAGIENLKDEKINNVKDQTEKSFEIKNKNLNWVKRVANWLANDQVSENDFLNLLKYLVKKGII